MKTPKKSLIIAVSIIGLLLVLIFCRFFIFKGLGNYLTDLDVETNANLTVVLSGGAFDRGNEAAKLYHQGKVKRILCVGGNQSGDLKSLGLNYFESDVTKINLMRSQIPDSIITVIHQGTSTFEESGVVLNYCLENKIDTLVLVSNYFHSHRIRNVFNRKFKEKGIQVYIHGARSSRYQEEKWWQSEDGLLALSNEYLKLLYYFLKK